MKKKEKVALDFGKSKKVSLEVKDCRGLMQGIGLMFSRREKAKNLLFKFNKPVKLAIHSFFVFYDFLAVWIGENGQVMEIKRVKPFLFYIQPRNKFKALVEIPINSKNKKILDGIEKFK